MEMVRYETLWKTNLDDCDCSRGVSSSPCPLSLLLFLVVASSSSPLPSFPLCTFGPELTHSQSSPSSPSCYQRMPTQCNVLVITTESLHTHTCLSTHTLTHAPAISAAHPPTRTHDPARRRQGGNTVLRGPDTRRARLVPLFPSTAQRQLGRGLGAGICSALLCSALLCSALLCSAVLGVDCGSRLRGGRAGAGAQQGNVTASLARQSTSQGPNHWSSARARAR
jgi:hypothetical protein